MSKKLIVHLSLTVLQGQLQYISAWQLSKENKRRVATLLNIIQKEARTCSKDSNYSVNIDLNMHFPKDINVSVTALHGHTLTVVWPVSKDTNTVRYCK